MGIPFDPNDHSGWKQVTIQASGSWRLINIWGKGRPKIIRSDVQLTFRHGQVIGQGKERSHSKRTFKILGKYTSKEVKFTQILEKQKVLYECSYISEFTLRGSFQVINNWERNRMYGEFELINHIHFIKRTGIQGTFNDSDYQCNIFELPINKF